MPFDLVMLSYIDRFGAQNVIDRPLGFGEIQRMLAAENIVRWAHERSRAESWAEWAKANPEKQRALLECE